MLQRLKDFWSSLFGGGGDVALGIYGPPNAGKTTLANRISEDLTG
ncbi:MAG: GTP-binding protein, partial [Candidatus Nanohaloarchaea archaeon]